MECVRNLYCPFNGNVVRQVAIGSAYPALKLSVQLGVKVYDLSGGVYSGIGATGAHDFDALTCGGKGRQGFFQLVLYGLTAGLRLPATIVIAVVTDAESVTHKSECRVFLNRAGRRKRVRRR